MYGFARAHFRRGFLDTVEVGSKYAFLTRWQRVSPLDSLTLSDAHYWLDGPHLAGAREVKRVALTSFHDMDRVGAGRRLAILSRAPHLAGLKELTAYGGLSATGVAAAIQNPTWSGLRKLELGLQSSHDALVPFADPSALAELDDLRLLGVRLNRNTVAALARSALLKRVRHFALSGGPINRETLPPLVAVVDRERIETFTLLLPRHDTLREYATGLLNRWFGDRAAVRLY